MKIVFKNGNCSNAIQIENFLHEKNKFTTLNFSKVNRYNMSVLINEVDGPPHFKGLGSGVRVCLRLPILGCSIKLHHFAS